MGGTWAEGVEAAARDGVTVVAEAGSFTVPVTASARQVVAGEFDLVLVLVKSWQTAGAALAAARAAGRRGTVVSLQNGLGNLEALQRHVEPGRVFAGTTTLGATMLGPARVRWNGNGMVSLPSALHGTPLPRLMRRAGVEVELVGDMERLQWSKLAVSCAINPLSALLGAPNGALLDDAEARRTLRAAALEVGAVAAARGIDLGEDPADRAEAVARSTAGNRSSMLQDLERGRRTEVDALNGAVVAEGLRLGVATPVNQWLVRCIRELERAQCASWSLTASRLWEASEEARLA